MQVPLNASGTATYVIMMTKSLHMFEVSLGPSATLLQLLLLLIATLIATTWRMPTIYIRKLCIWLQAHFIVYFHINEENWLDYPLAWCLCSMLTKYSSWWFRYKRLGGSLLVKRFFELLLCYTSNVHNIVQCLNQTIERNQTIRHWLLFNNLSAFYFIIILIQQLYRVITENSTIYVVLAEWSCLVQIDWLSSSSSFLSPVIDVNIKFH